MIEAKNVADWVDAPFADKHMEMVVAAVNVYVDALPSIERTEGGAWDKTTILGATMLAARLYKRRNSPNGIESFAEMSHTYISRYDSDIARLLHMESFRKPRAR
ncbi:hypothetical protein E4U03_10955 [Rothia nasimurium]|uniref:Uncharacterized protein n=1 Tax=Rothia nasimurium TaxID=85336 RepID=A0A4Y9F2B1_9MICC|nr:hypothetical protein [Rothia nasimurium]MBF0809117.1 hypothetical protein [Rothia nasimurium]TFU20639.1 hypothetical protein E4U03_10955 [Rothia nasimurium]